MRRPDQAQRRSGKPEPTDDRTCRNVVASLLGPAYQVATDTYTYDAEGNRTKRTETASGDYVTYAWDHRNRLTTVTFHDSLGSPQKVVSYTYDVFDRRIRKEVDVHGDGTIDHGEQFVYDGEDVALVYDLDGDLLARYMHGPGVDQVLAADLFTSGIPSSGQTYWTLTDHLGSVIHLMDNQGVLYDENATDAYGRQLYDVNDATDLTYAFTGREWDKDAELQYSRARWYDPRIGRFISEDPIGFAAGDTNVSRYVGNSPTNAIDPSGMFEEPTTEQLAQQFEGVKTPAHNEEGLKGSDGTVYRFGRRNILITGSEDDIRWEGGLVVVGLAPERRDLFLTFVFLMSDVERRIAHLKRHPPQRYNSRGGHVDYPRLQEQLQALESRRDELIEEFNEEGFGDLPVAGFARGFTSDMGRNEFRGTGLEFAVTALSAAFHDTNPPGLQETTIQDASMLLLTGQLARGIARVGAAAARSAVTRITARSALTMAEGSPTWAGSLVSQYARRVKPVDGFTDVFIHGTRDGKAFFVLHNGESIMLNQRQIATWLKSQGVSGDIRLVSCYSGSCSTGSVAQNLANKLGVRVRAPTDLIKVHPNGTLSAPLGTKWRDLIPGGR